MICDGSESAAFSGRNVEGNRGEDALVFMSVAEWEGKTGMRFHFPANCNTGKVDPTHWNFTHSLSWKKVD